MRKKAASDSERQQRITARNSQQYQEIPPIARGNSYDAIPVARVIRPRQNEPRALRQAWIQRDSSRLEARRENILCDLGNFRVDHPDCVAHDEGETSTMAPSRQNVLFILTDDLG